VLGLAANLHDDLEENLYIEQFENFKKKKIRALGMQVEEEPLWLEASAVPQN
jgi:hypothetical protein